MESLILSLHVVFPLFILMSLGYVLKIIQLFDEHTLNKMNAIVFRIFLPVLLFLNVYNSNIEETFNMKLLIYTIILILLSFVSLCFIMPRFVKDNHNISVMIQGIYRSNFVLFGIPVTASIYGYDKVGLASLMSAFVVPLFNVLAVIVFEVYGEGSTNIKKVIIGLFKNPLISASFMGLLFLSLQIKLPILITDTLSDIGGIATPLSLIILGGTFTFTAARAYVKYLVTCCFGKLILLPTIAIVIGILLGFRQVELIIIMAIFGSPTAVGSFAMAQALGGNGELAGEIVVATSTVSILTIFSWIFILNQYGLI